jgi:hypothetical protein
MVISKQDELLKHISEYANRAFYQGYKAKERGIDINDNKKLAKMSEAYPRIAKLQQIFNLINTGKSK